MDEITPAALSARLSHGESDLYVLDVQPATDYNDWHVPGSVNLDVYEKLRSDPEAARSTLSTIPEDRDVVVACTAGEPARIAANLLREMDYNVSTLACHRPAEH